MQRLLALSVVLLAGCYSDLRTVDRPDDTDTESDTDVDADSDADTDADFDIHGLTDGPKTLCDGYEETPIAGATTYFVGDFEFDGTAVSGWEYWVLFANPAWIDTGEGWDCKIAWEISGHKAAPMTCVSCDYSLDLEATFDETRTDCVSGLVDQEGQDFSIVYDVRVTESTGDMTLYFGSSGNELGTGEADDTGLIYVTDSICSFF